MLYKIHKNPSQMFYNVSEESGYDSKPVCWGANITRL
jgi:hypothetical protein